MIGFVLVIVLLPDRIKLSMGWILLLFVFLEDTITIRLGSGSAITHWLQFKKGTGELARSKRDHPYFSPTSRANTVVSLQAKLHMVFIPVIVSRRGFQRFRFPNIPSISECIFLPCLPTDFGLQALFLLHHRVHYTSFLSALTVTKS